MAQITNIPEFTEYWRNKFPSLYKHKTDEDVINLVRERHPELGIPPYQNASITNQKRIEETQPPEEDINNANSLKNQNTDPSWVDSWFLTGDFIPDKWQEQGVAGISADFFKQAYNNSMAGQLYKTVHGEDKWEENPGYDPAWYAQAGQFAVGMMSPLDAATMLGTGALGKVVSGVTRAGFFGRGAGAKYLEKGILSSFSSKYPKIGTAAMNTLDGALNLGVGGGAFAASHALVHETARQRVENPDKPININKALKVASNEFLHSAPMFAIAGGVTQGLMGSIYGYSTAYASKNPSYATKITQAMTHPLSRVGAEAGLFTSLPAVMGDEEAPKIGTKDWWAAFGTNALIVGGMRAVGAFTEDKYFDAHKFIKTEMKLENATIKKTVEAHKSLVDKLGANAPKESRDIVRKWLVEEGKLNSDIKGVKKNIEFIQEMNRKLTDPDYLAKTKVANSKENIEFAKYAELVNEYATGTNGIISKVLSDESNLRSHFKELNGRDATSTELVKFKKNLENWHDNINKNKEWVDDYLGGNWRQSENGIDGGNPGQPNIAQTRTVYKPSGDTRRIALKEWSNEEIIKYAKKEGFQEGVEFKVKDNKVVNKERLINRIFDKAKAERFEKLEELRATGKGMAEQVAEEIGVYREPQAQRRLDIDKQKYETLVQTKDVFKNKSYPEKTRENIIKEVVNEISKISDGDNLLETAVLNSLKSIKGKKAAASTVTLKSYSRGLKSYIEYLKKKGIDFFDATDMNLKDFLTKDGKIKQLGNVSNSDAAAIRNLYKWMGSKSGYNLRFDPSEWIQNIFNAYNKQAKLRQKKLPDFENWNKSIDSILKDFNKKKNNREVYDRAEVFLEVGNQTGIRNQEWFTQDYPGVSVKDIFHIKNGKETLGLNTKEINFIKISPETSKTGTERYVPLTPKSAKSIKKLIDKYNLKSNDLLISDKFKSKVRDIVNKKLQSKTSNKKVRIDDWRDIAQQTATYGAELSPKELQLINNMLGHQMTAIERIYLKDVNVERIVKDTYDAVIKMQEAQGKPKPIAAKNVKQKRAERLPEENVFQTKADKAIRDKFISNVMKKNNLTNEQLKRVGLDKGVLGEFGEGTIKLAKGLWQPSDFYHENLHRLKQFAKASNNKGLIKLIERGEKLAIGTKEYKAWKKKNVNRDVEEFLADIVGGKASRMEFSTGMLNKINQFVKQLVSRVKVAFGAGNFKDISRVLSKRVQKGFSTEGVKFAKGDVKFKMEGMTPEAALKFAKGNVKELFKEGELTKSSQNRLIRYIGEIAGLGEEFKLTKETPIPAIEQFVSTISTMDAKLLKRLPDKLEWWSTFRDAEKLRLVKNVKEKERISLLKDLEVQDGSIYKASTKQLRDFIEIVNTMDDVKKSTTSWIDERVAEGKLNRDVAERFKAISNKKWGLPVATVLESVGLKKLAQKLYNHTYTELKGIGEFSTFEANMKGVFGNRRWDKVKDMIYLFDKERYYARLSDGLLSNAEKSFINRTFDISNKKKWVIKSSKEGTLAKEYIKLMKYYKEAFVGPDGALRQVLNAAEFEKFMADKNIHWLNPENNVYVQRRLTQEFKKHYHPNERHFKELVENQTEHIAKKMAKMSLEKDGKTPTKQQIKEKAKEFYDDANAMAHGELYELFEFNPGKYSPSFLKERHAKLPEFIKIDGKKIQVYETGFGLTVKDYAINQSKFLANVEFFPEFVKLKGFNIPGAKELLGQLKTKDSTLASWVDRRVKDHLKIGKEVADYPDGIRLVRHTTALMAKFQLSFPTSGIKNFLIGNTQSLLAFRLRDFFGGLADAIHKDNRAMVIATGATEIGMRHFEMGGAWKVADKIATKGFFRWGLMKPSENLNRYISVLAGKRDQMHLTRRLQFSKEGSRSYKAAENKLKSFYKLSNNEVALLKKFGMEGVKGLDGKTAGLNKRAIDNLYQKMNTYAHINTQGASINLFMPDWAGGPLAQSALLYKRMAYAATVNTTRNMKIALQNKSLLQPIMFGLGTYLSGEVLIQFYDKLLGQTMPKENSNEFKILQTTLWKGEFLGILSEFLSPFGEGHLGQTLYPSVLSTAGVMYNSFMSVLEGKRFVSQGVDNLMKGTTGLYNNTRKLYKQGLLAKDSFPSQGKRFAKFYMDMLEEYGDRDEIIGQGKINLDFERNKYMQSFKDLFDSGYSEDLSGNSLGKWYMMCLFAKANDYFYSGITESGFAIKTEQEAVQAAVKSMKASLTNLNPNKAKITAKTLKGKISQAKKAIQFYEWLDRKEPLSKELKKLESQYEYRKRLLAESLVEYIKSANLEKDLKHYGIKIGELVFK